MEYPQCVTCNKIFRNINTLKSHQANVHMNIKPYLSHMCNICLKSFKNITGYKNHLKTHKKCLRCSHCDYVTTKNADLKVHVGGHKLGTQFCCQCNSFVGSETAHSHKHTDLSVMEKQKHSHSIGFTDTSTAQGTLELTLSCAVLEACQQLCPGQLLQMSGTSSNLTTPSISHDEEISLCAVKNDAKLTLILKAATMGSVFQQKLSQSWRCDVSSLEIIEADSGQKEGTAPTCGLHDALTHPEHKQLVHPATKSDQDQHLSELRGENPSAGDSEQQTMQPVNNTADESWAAGKSNISDDKKLVEREPVPVVVVNEKCETIQQLQSDEDAENRKHLEEAGFEMRSKYKDSSTVDTESLMGIGSGEDSDTRCSSKTKNEIGVKEDYCGSHSSRNDESSDNCSLQDEGSSLKADSSATDKADRTQPNTNKRQRVFKDGALKLAKHKKSASWSCVKPVSQSEPVSGSKGKGQLGRSKTQRIGKRKRSMMRRNVAVESKDGQLTAGKRLKLENVESQNDFEQEWCMDELQGYTTMAKTDRKLRDEVQELNPLVIDEMVAMGGAGTEKLAKNSGTEELTCVLCLKVFKNYRWYFFCRHLKEIHFITAVEYRNLLLLESSTERLEKITHYKEQQLQMVKEYKEVKYKVGKDQLIQCPGCMTILSTFNALCTHIRSIHLHDTGYLDLVAYAEDLREKRMTSSEKLANRLALTLVCDYCGMKRVGMNGIKVHLHMAHPNESDLKEKLTKYRNFVKETNLKLRREQYHKDVKSKQKGVLCRFCGEKFSFRSSRGRHEKYSCEYNPNRIRMFTCQFCDRRFLSKEDLVSHRRQHIEDDFKFVCDICGVVRRTKAGMYDHKKNKHGTKPPKHKCPYCQKMFYNRDRMKTHMTVHSDVRPFQCEICGNSFKTRAAVVKHQNAMHYNKYTYYCDKCGHGVSKLAYLQSHKCGRIRRSQGAREGPKAAESVATTTEPIQVIQAQTIILPELTTLPKMETHQLVYDDQLDKDGVAQDAELGPHILMGTNIQVNGSTIQTVSMPYTIDASQQLVDVLPQHAVGSSFNQDFTLSQVTVIDYANAAQLVDSRPMKMQYSNAFTDQNAL